MGENSCVGGVQSSLGLNEVDAPSSGVSGILSSSYSTLDTIRVYDTDVNASICNEAFCVQFVKKATTTHRVPILAKFVKKVELTLS